MLIMLINSQYSTARSFSENGINELRLDRQVILFLKCFAYKLKSDEFSSKYM